MIDFKSKDVKYFIKISVFIFVSLVCIFLTFIYYFSRNYIISEIDKRLLVAAESIKHILPADYHDRAVKNDGISEAEYKIAERKLTEYADKLKLKYIWTDIEYKGEYYLTSCNKTDISSDTGLEIYYFMKYEDGISNEEMIAFNSSEPVFSFNKDRWGHFRTVFIPSVSPYGNKYLSCAEYTFDYVNELLKNSTIFTLIVSIMLFLMFVPVFATYIIYAGKKENELKNKNRELEETYENLRITLHSISDGVIVTDSDGKIKIMNKTAEDITGCNLINCSGKSISEILKIHDPVTMKEIDNPVTEVLKNENKVESKDNALIFGKNRQKIRISRSAAPIESSDGVLIGVVAVIRDISNQFRLEEELKLARNIESVGKLAGGIAHDYNNMLGAILSSAELLQMQVKDSTSLEYIKIIIDITHKAAELTSNLLTFSRKKTKKIEVFNINRAVSNVVSLMQRKFSKNIVIKTNLNAEEKYMKGDIHDIENALYNIAVNSRDSMPFGGFLNIYTENRYLDSDFCENTVFEISEGNFIMVKITDTGSGINSEIIGKIFDPYFSYGKGSESSGIGLSVVYGTVLEHSGAVYVESTENTGTEIVLYFPAVYNE